ncbi:response regulator [Phormidium sp. CCY1219]|uniref:response regulator n=1 Tax=Phormidium sp. CCY1219 TaxID=2886104 RepID=UPI002D1F8197|nr:response regulator [Phormidium sp. CCY1219]MEB3830378.1 response regulator [Phormidium sp. CCY1219]
MKAIAPDNMILLVEDDANYAKIVQLVFEKANLPFTLQVVKNGEEAQLYLSHCNGGGKSDRATPMPKLVLTDINMPRLSGLELLAWIADKPRLKHLPVVVMSSCFDEEQIQTIERLGARAYFTKPFSLKELLNRLTTCVSNLQQAA